VSGRRGNELLALPVRFRGIQLGRPADLLLERDTFRVVGLDVLCGDGGHRFLPLSVAIVGDTEIAILSTLLLREENELEFYRAGTLALGTLRTWPVEVRGVAAGTLADIVVARDGRLLAVFVEREGRTQRIPFGESVRLAPRARSAA
jgi:hypothetical protein